MARMTAAQAAVLVLEKEGVKDLFGVPGAAINPFYSALRGRNSMRHVLARHVEGASHMAEGNTRAGTAAGFGPIDQNIFAWSDAERARIKALPSSLNEALRALEADHAFLTEGEVFREEMIAQWVDFKRNQEYYAVRNRPHPYEMSLYFDV